MAVVRGSHVGRGWGLRERSAAPQKGLVLTFVAVAALALGTASGWWPQPAAESGGGQLVAVQASNGERVCGSLAPASPGTLRVSVDGRPVDVSLQNVAAVDPVDSC